MTKQMSGGKFGLEISALTKARNMAEANSFNQKSRANYEAVMETSAALINRVNAFLAKNGAIPTSGCGSSSLFGVITSDKDPQAPCGITFYGSPELAQALANAFPSNKVISAHDGEVIKPVAATASRQVRPRSGPRL